MNIAVYGSKHPNGKVPLIIELLEKLKQSGASLFVENGFLTYLKSECTFDASSFSSFEENLPAVEMAISIGGDGTFLRTTHRVARLGLPILGINVGRLGFLTDVDPYEAMASIDQLLASDFSIEERALLALKTELAGFDYDFALNEVALLKQETGSMIRVNAYLGQDYLAGYDADGLIIATPSGSTAYSLSCNGPIIMPGSSSLVITPIAPHMLNMRPLVVPDRLEIRLEVESRSNNYLLVVDGHSITLPCSQQLHLKRADHVVKMIRLRPHSFAETLRRKLKWGTAFRE